MTPVKFIRIATVNDRILVNKMGIMSVEKIFHLQK